MSWEIKSGGVAQPNRYALAELQKDVDAELLKLNELDREKYRPDFAVFVVHNKLKEKVGKLPSTIP